MMILSHPTWMYHEWLGGRLFQPGEEIPVGWYDSPEAAAQPPPAPDPAARHRRREQAEQIFGQLHEEHAKAKGKNGDK